MLEHWWTVPVGIAAALVTIWLALAVTLWLVKPCPADQIAASRAVARITIC